jgi:F-box/leucine-rich repeat protein 14
MLSQLRRFTSCKFGIGHLAGQSPHAATGTLELEHLGLQDCQKLTDQALKHVSGGIMQLKTINLSFCGSVTDTGLKFIFQIL